MKKLIAIISVMAAFAAAFTSCEKDEIVGTNDGNGLYLNKVELTLVKGNSEALVATVTPKGASSVKWATEDKKVATVNAEGVVKAVGAGETVITVSAGDRSVECVVKVQSPVTSLSLNKSEIVIAKGAETEVKATVGPNDINVDFKYSWISSDETIFKVTADSEDQSKAVIKGLKGGFATLYVQAGDVTTSIPVTIDVDLEGLVIKGAPIGKVYKGDSFQFNVDKDPIDAIDELSPIWSSSDEDVLVVDETTGLVVAVGPGTATIFVESNGFTSSVVLTVNVLATLEFYPKTIPYTIEDLTFTTNSYPYSSYMYVYNGDTMTFSVPENMKITEIKISLYASYYPFSATVDCGSFDNNSLIWTGESDKVTFTATRSSYLNRFTVTYKD